MRPRSCGTIFAGGRRKVKGVFANVEETALRNMEFMPGVEEVCHVLNESFGPGNRIQKEMVLMRLVGGRGYGVLLVPRICSDFTTNIPNCPPPCSHSFCERCFWNDAILRINALDEILCPVCQSSCQVIFYLKDTTTMTPSRLCTASLKKCLALSTTSSSLKALPEHSLHNEHLGRLLLHNDTSKTIFNVCW